MLKLGSNSPGSSARGLQHRLVAAGTTIGSNEIFMFAPGRSTPLNTISLGYVQLANDGAALTPDGSLLFAVTLASTPMLNSSRDASSGQATITVTPRATVTALTCQQVLPVLDKCTATVRRLAPCITGRRRVAR